MSNKLIIDELSNIVRDGKKEVEKLLNKDQSIITESIIVPSKEEGGFFKGVVGDFQKKEVINRFIYGDNLNIMKELIKGESCPSLKGKIDLIYIDPPFLSKADYNTKISLPLKDKKVTIEKFAYSDIWKEGIVSYLKMLYPRLLLMKELLSDEGSIYVHLDWHIVHYVKILMDEIFGEDMFLNEIIWSYKSGGVSKKYFSRKHDTILLYSKTGKYIFNPQKEKSYNRGLKPYRFKGVEEFVDDIGWYTLVNMKDVWNIDMVGRTSKERVGYATQKPEKLLERIILSSTNENSIVADFFAGSGTTAAVAERLNRKWILSDMGLTSALTVQKRIIDIKGHQFLFQRLEGEELTSNGELKIKGIDKQNLKDKEELISIELEGYEIDIDNIPIEKKYKKLVEEVLEEDSLNLIDFISIDPDYNGEVFISRWQNFRENDIYKVEEFIELKLPKKQKRNIAVKVVDVFGYENKYIFEV
ncbi:MAG TPA: site-specific DNA-methyltransferase [Tissierellia bacterium]|nr:site-specific DNA-methyltransferase [Tissierellia bacterium]